MSYQVAPLTSELWPAFEDLFGRQGACYGCWCTHFRLPPAVRRENNRERNKDHIKARIEAGPPPGLLLVEGGRADGWMQIGPRGDVPEWNNRGRVSAPVEDGDDRDPTVWAISCFFLRPSARRKGLSHHLVAAGIDHARVEGARFLEACPITHSRDTRSVGLFVGSTRVFEKAGFETVLERKAGRPLMRLRL
ncbi:Acetyltransferase (GNAT) family protein [Nitratireductor aquibiodomus]|uniref:Acetyltransferase (GNAT) family protein n=1 Tax=Nitratireductor aquibiodomus TaxID=204799 RepID=A0A1H4IXF6_9HYPH|nr:GNAT family N-acetyltransferase [Nitratireductor aquibiodomus]SEB38018.1 Acetyltransferase (GNAT) family protein [Nitratireductor aquibiodomus]